ncbi:MAG: cation-translocating P-type ATPase [Oscillospiraceae bacterium]|nr:cation-translocating P-type ATPase [Oscillospiraceae bacterium]
MGNDRHGLSKLQVLQSRERYGANIITGKKRKTFLRSFLESFADPMIKILMIALFINICFMFRDANWIETAGIAAAVLLATFVGTVSEYGSETAFEKLQEQAMRINCRVIRDGNIIEIPTAEVVVGDSVIIGTGDKIPADGILVKGKVEVDRSALNGETKEVEIKPNGELQSGSIVCSGECIMQVTKVGDKTVYGKIGLEVSAQTRESPLKYRLTVLAKKIGRFSYLAAIFTALAYLFNVILLDNGFDLAAVRAIFSEPGILFGHIIKALTFAVTVIVMAVPEGLPMMITVVLSTNMKRMLKDNVLVRKLTGIETAGSMNILFTDKTGTLTKGKLEVNSGFGIGNKEFLKNALYYNTSANMSDGAAIGGNATDRALLEYAIKINSTLKRMKKVKTVPFSSTSKFMATECVGQGGVRYTFIKGAPEKILPHCTGCYDAHGEVRPLDIAERRRIEREIQTASEKAVRLIAVAAADTGDPASEDGRFKNLNLAGVLGLRDEIRKEAIKGVRAVHKAGIQTVMLTGDSKPTARAIAREAGIIRDETDAVLTSEEMARLSDEEIADMLRPLRRSLKSRSFGSLITGAKQSETVHRLRVIARALPSDKSRLVRIAQEKGLVVGMTGDGVNDAPALKAADIGFAMGSGTEIAKEAGDIVILDDNFNSISKAICYGRTIFRSIRKFIVYQMSICMCAVGVTVLGSMLGVEFPITIVQMLWINIVMDTLAGLAFSGEKARDEYMSVPPKPRDEPIMTREMFSQIAITGIYTTVLCLFFLKSDIIQRLFVSYGETYAMTAFFALFMFTAIFTSFCARTHKINLFSHLSSNRLFLWIMGAVTAIQLFIIYYGGAVFRTSGLELWHLGIIAALAFTVVPVDMIRKKITYR